MPSFPFLSSVTKNSAGGRIGYSPFSAKNSYAVKKSDFEAASLAFDSRLSTFHLTGISAELPASSLTMIVILFVKSAQSIVYILFQTLVGECSCFGVQDNSEMFFDTILPGVPSLVKILTSSSSITYSVVMPVLTSVCETFLSSTLVEPNFLFNQSAIPLTRTKLDIS